MYMPQPEKTTLDIAIAIAPIFVSLGTLAVGAYVAFIGNSQRKIAREKLRLDLYNRRFEIYETALTFNQLVDAFSGTRTDEFNFQQRRLTKAAQESRFLFEPSSNIPAILAKIREDASTIIGVKTYGKEVANAGDPHAFSKYHQTMTDALQRMPQQLDQLAEAMAPYLNFHRISD